LIWSIKSNKTP